MELGYYDQLASDYDHVRFGNSYGQYVDAQERRLLRQWLAPYRDGAILDLACGTGRLLDLATHGLDLSAPMVDEAQRKHPAKPVHCLPAVELGRLGIEFDAVFCLHLFMHLPLDEGQAIVRACAPCVRRGGVLMFDAPSALRRKLTRFRTTGWHGGTALSAGVVESWAGKSWKLHTWRGVLFFPVHRISARFRRWFRPWDDLIGATPLKRISSYLFFCLERQ